MTANKKTIKWNAGAPPRRGVYKSRSDGPSPNVGYRYWDGKRWGMLWTTHALAQEMKCDGRRSRLTYPVLWASLVPATETQRDPAIELLEHQLQLSKDLATERLQQIKAERERSDRFKSCLRWVLDNPRAHPVNREKAIKAAIGE
jgi:hypothetical protein